MEEARYRALFLAMFMLMLMIGGKCSYLRAKLAHLVGHLPAASGEAWKFYDLGHGYCTYDFFEQCPHRMACARCSFYVPKESSRAQLLEAKTNLLRMMQEIPLQEEERAAVEDGINAVEKLYAQLMDVPTPAGPTPREIEGKMRRELPILR